MARKNLSREDFLALALEALQESGQCRLHLDSLMEAMPVTKGSFYHHFESRGEFLKALGEYWKDVSTKVEVDLVTSTAPVVVTWNRARSASSS